MSKNQTVDLVVRRGLTEFHVTVPAFHVEKRTGLNRPKKNHITRKLLDNNIGYVDISRLEMSQIHEMMTELEGARAIILDQRRYPRSGTVDTLTNKYLSPQSKQFSLIKIPNPRIAGTYYYLKYYIGPKKGNQNYYKGQIVILAAEHTGSAAEFNVMKLQTLPDVFTIGRQTTGSDGNVVRISLPGYLRARHSGIGIYYPDTAQTQRVGVRIDQSVERTWDELVGREDPILEAALKFIGR
jgi:C-terminal processing protease CtpA/Prc